LTQLTGRGVPLGNKVLYALSDLVKQVSTITLGKKVGKGKRSSESRVSYKKWVEQSRGKSVPFSKKKRTAEQLGGEIFERELQPRGGQAIAW